MFQLSSASATAMNLALDLDFRLIAHAMGHMPGGHHLPGFLAMAGLVVKKHVGGKRFKERRFFQAAEKQRLVQADIPLTQGADHSLMGRCRTRRHQRGADRARLIGELALQQIEGRQEALEWPTAQRLAGRLPLAGLERFQAAALVDAL